MGTRREGKERRRDGSDSGDSATLGKELGRCILSGLAAGRERASKMGTDKVGDLEPKKCPSHLLILLLQPPPATPSATPTAHLLHSRPEQWHRRFLCLRGFSGAYR